MMELHILRHAIAVDRGTPGYDHDRRRPLTPDGREKMRDAARGMKAMGLSFDWIVSSPLVRAKDTARIVAGALKLRRKVKISEHLAPEGGLELLVEQLAGMPGSPKRLLVVGHEPDLSRLIGTLIGGGKSVGLKLKKGGLCKLTADKLKFGRCAELEWLLTPRQLAGLGNQHQPKRRSMMPGARFPSRNSC